jgi:hypothetical protein
MSEGITQRLALSDTSGGRLELDPKVLNTDPLLWHHLERGARRALEQGTLRCGMPVLERLRRRIDAEACRDANTSAIRKGAARSPRRSQTSRVTGAMSRTVVTLSSSAEAMAVITTPRRRSPPSFASRSQSSDESFRQAGGRHGACQPVPLRGREPDEFLLHLVEVPVVGPGRERQISSASSGLSRPTSCAPGTTAYGWSCRSTTSSAGSLCSAGSSAVSVAPA